MAEMLTPQQKEAVWNRGGRLLVSAAAGSGKTKVLVDRLMSYLTDSVQPANLDDFLIITYTKAAASELRGKIAAKLSEKIAQSPGNRHLQQQMQRLYLAKISTVHSYCTDLLREYAYLMDIPGDFRVADETECSELQGQVLEQILESAYASAAENPDFLAFINSQGLGRDDRQIPGILLSVYQNARCHLDPNAWLQWCLESVQADGAEDAAQTVWGAYLLENLRAYLSMQLEAIDRCIREAAGCDGMVKPVALLQDTAAQLQRLYASQSWDEAVSRRNIDYGVLRFPKSCQDMELAEHIKAVRNACKTGVEKKLRCFISDSSQILTDLEAAACAARGLIQLVRTFSNEYDRLKKLRRVLDFGDLEHRTLDLLMGKSRSGPTALSRQIALRYREIMVDEYQDSNGVQDAIFDILTRDRQNCFMVGDVKQSIYQFRLADPGIFIEKYNTYAPAVDAKPGEGRKVQLSSNFRSCGGVIDAVNHVFATCMSPQVGGLVYGEEEMLREGIPHCPLGEPEVELYGIDVQEDTYAEEAAFVAEKIHDLLNGSHMVRSGEGLRPVTAGDIVILLRSPGSVKGEFLYALEQRGIPCTAGDSVDLLQTEEVTVLRSLLQVISNPLQDIPLISVLASRIFCFTASELAMIRGRNRKSYLYECLCKRQLEKCIQFVELLNQLRSEARLYSISELLQRIFLHTAMDSLYASMPDGLEKKRNLTEFCQLAAQFEGSGHKDLARFLEYLQTVEENGAVSLNRESSADTVTIMSIHKSKGLEFPVVFLCGLSRSFNQESSRAQVLCHKELGLGLSCVDEKNRVRYSSIAKKAIAAKIQAESISEEMRVLYVAMTRPKDRLIMTYAVKNLEKDLADIALRRDLSPGLLMTGQADCPGAWVLLSAMSRIEAGEFFKIGGKPDTVSCEGRPWAIRVVTGSVVSAGHVQTAETAGLEDVFVKELHKSLSFQYAYETAREVPSKRTATQLKGRPKDREVAESTEDAAIYMPAFRKPSFIQGSPTSAQKGTAVHNILQHIDYQKCGDMDGIRSELDRLTQQQFITQEQAALVDPCKILTLFQAPVGKQMMACPNVVREFKFSILEDARQLGYGVDDEQILLQGVVDCALLEDDGIIVIDFKTDRATEEAVQQLVARYTAQVTAYSRAVSKIYQRNVKARYLYVFSLDRFIEIP